jgi:hypothetical protein
LRRRDPHAPCLSQPPVFTAGCGRHAGCNMVTVRRVRSPRTKRSSRDRALTPDAKGARWRSNLHCDARGAARVVPHHALHERDRGSRRRPIGIIDEAVDPNVRRRFVHPWSPIAPSPSLHASGVPPGLLTPKKQRVVAKKYRPSALNERSSSAHAASSCGSTVSRSARKSRMNSTKP